MSHRIQWFEGLLYVSLFGGVLWCLSLVYVKDGAAEKKIKHNISISQLWQMMKDMMKRQQIWLNGIYAMLMFSLVSGFAAFWGIPFLQAQFEVEIDLIAGCNALIFVGAAVGAPFMGWISGFVGKRTPLMSFAAMACTGIICIIIYVPIHSIYFMGILFALLGFFSGAYVLPFAIVRDQVNVKSQGAAMAFINMLCGLLGAPILQPLIAVLLNLMHDPSTGISAQVYTVTDYQFALSMFVIATILSFLIALAIKDKSTEI